MNLAPAKWMPHAYSLGLTQGSSVCERRERAELGGWELPWAKKNQRPWTEMFKPAPGSAFILQTEKIAT